MDVFSILAETAAQVEETSAAARIVPIDIIWNQITNLGLIEAMTFMSFGVVCLFYGWRVFKVLVVICFAMAGLAIGWRISNIVGGGNSPLLGILLGVALGIVSVPLMRWSVGVLGAVAGALITGGLWYAFQLPEQYMWAGALVGFVAGGMMSFIVFKVAVMLFSSLGGSLLVVAGVLALMHQYEPSSAYIKEMFYGPKWFLSSIILVPTVIGIWAQNRMIKGSKDWSV